MIRRREYSSTSEFDDIFDFLREINSIEILGFMVLFAIIIKIFYF